MRVCTERKVSRKLMCPFHRLSALKHVFYTLLHLKKASHDALHGFCYPTIWKMLIRNLETHGICKLKSSMNQGKLHPKIRSDDINLDSILAGVYKILFHCENLRLSNLTNYFCLKCLSFIIYFDNFDRGNYKTATAYRKQYCRILHKNHSQVPQGCTD